jgi:hypothetical protein
VCICANSARHHLPVPNPRYNPVGRAFFSVTLNSSDLPDDNYVWNLQFKDSTGHGPAIPEIAISDVINGTAGDVGQTSDPLIGSSTNEEGCLTFTSTCPLPTPPPQPHAGRVRVSVGDAKAYCPGPSTARLNPSLTVTSRTPPSTHRFQRGTYYPMRCRALARVYIPTNGQFFF